MMAIIISAIMLTSSLLLAGTTKAKYVPGQLIIKFQPGLIETSGTNKVPISQVTINNSGIASALQHFKTQTVERVYKYCDVTSHLSSVYSLEMDKDLDMRKVADEFMKLPGVIYAGPNFIGVFLSTPNDPDFSLQWGLNNTTSPLCDINAPEAWDIQTGNHNVTLAVVDAGLAPQHYNAIGTEFYGRIFDNPTNKYLWDGPYGTQDITTGDYAGHGSHVTGIAAAATNNGNSPWNGHGMAGVAGGWNGEAVSLISAKIGDENGENVLSSMQAIEWAMYSGADIITGGFGWDETNPPDPSDVVYFEDLFEACAEAFASGATLFFAAGNHGNCGYSDISIPAIFAKYDICCAVGAMDISGLRVDGIGGSSWGPELSFVAPGGSGLPATQIWSTTVPEDYYGYKAGTSMAAPCAAGVGALIYSQALERGYQLEDVDCKRIMEASARDITYDTEHPEWCNSGWDPMTGYGCVDAYKALSHLQEPYELSGGSVSNMSSIGGSWCNITFTRNVTGQVYPTGQIHSIKAGLYSCYVSHLTGTVTFDAQHPYVDPPWTWGRILKLSPGIKNENPCDAYPWVGVSEVTSGYATYETYVYGVVLIDTIISPKYDTSYANYLCYVPRLPSNIAIEYKVLGKKRELYSRSGIDENSSSNIPSLSIRVVSNKDILVNYAIPLSQGQLDIFDASGRRVVSNLLTNAKGYIDLGPEHLPAGCYFARLSSSGCSCGTKFVVLH